MATCPVCHDQKVVLIADHGFVFLAACPNCNQGIEYLSDYAKGLMGSGFDELYLAHEKTNKEWDQFMAENEAGKWKE